MSYVLPLLQDAFVISIVTFAVTVSLAKVFARQYNYSVDSNQVQVIYMYMYNMYSSTCMLLNYLITLTNSNSPSQEFMAYGIMNIVGCFFSSFPAAGSLSRSLVQANAGGKTQLVGFISSLSLMVILLKLGPYFEQLPRVS